MKESKLGRGLFDLLEENHQDILNNEQVIDLDISLIRPNPDQPRTTFEPNSLAELADSIREHGVVQPIIVKPTGKEYTIVAGERRVRASQQLGLTTIPAIVRDYNMIYLAEIAILENLQREDLNPVEEAVAYLRLTSNHGITHEELGKKVGKSRSYITNVLGLLSLPRTILDALIREDISAGHARALSKIKDEQLCLSVFEMVINDGLNVRDLETYLKSLKTKPNEAISKKVIKQYQRSFEEKYSDKFNFKLTNSKLTFHFTSEDELKEIFKLLYNKE